ncbi:hypothetical protein T10_4829 [Trichinella papuae]|uniref:Potential DNA-binding domain-containing protein n=1 Tax=Trichinella papuae TaxID=268474 RepID=A0A0V1M5X2_9BILA|nr:hypothetical protein T10_4829 [Trichinella papuae]
MEDYFPPEPYISNPEVEDGQIIRSFVKGFRKGYDSEEVRTRKKISKLLQMDIAEMQANEDSENVLVLQPMLSTTVSPVYSSGGMIDPSCFDSRNSGLNFSKEPISIRVDQGDAAMDEQVLSIYSKMGVSHSDALNAVEALKRYVLGRSDRSVFELSSDSDKDCIIYPLVEVPTGSGFRRYRCFTKIVNSEFGRCEVLLTPLRFKQCNNAKPEADSSGQDGERADKAAKVDRVHWELAILKRPKWRGVANPKIHEPKKFSGKMGMPHLGKRSSIGQRICVFHNPVSSMRSRISNSAAASFFHNLPFERKKCRGFASKQLRSNEESNREQITKPRGISVVSRLYKKYFGGGSKPLNCFSNVEDFQKDEFRPKCIYQAPGDAYCCGMDVMPFLLYCSYHAHMAKNEFPIKRWNFSAIERKQYCMEHYGEVTGDLNQEPESALSNLSEPQRKRWRPEGYVNSHYDSESSSSEEENSDSQIPPKRRNVACVDFVSFLLIFNLNFFPHQQVSEQQFPDADAARFDDLSTDSEIETDDGSVSETSTSVEWNNGVLTKTTASFKGNVNLHNFVVDCHCSSILFTPISKHNVFFQIPMVKYDS